MSGRRGGSTTTRSRCSRSFSRRKAQSAARSCPNCAASCSLASRVSLTIGSSHIGSALKFLRCTYYWRLVARQPALAFDGSPDRRVRDMRTVPGEQKVHPVNRRNGNVESIRLCVRSQSRSTQEQGRKTFRLDGDGKNGQSLNETQTLLCHLRIAEDDLSAHHFGHEQLVLTATSMPPLPSELLVAKNDDITAQPTNHIAD